MKLRKQLYTKIHRLFRKIRPRTRRQKRRLARASGIAVLLVAAVFVYNKVVMMTISPAAYAPLLNTIAKGESNGNYNAYFGHGANEEIRFTDMSVAEVLQWQASYVAQGSPSSAVGKYQIVRSTLSGLVQELELGAGQKFDKAMQDRMAIALIERRGAISFVENKISRSEFAANLSKEWAALPRVNGPNPSQSHYAGDGLNKASISIDEILGAIDRLKTAADAENS